MNDEMRLAAAQLNRMRGMTRYYHARFFSDVRFSAVAFLALFVLGFWDIPEAFLLIPPVAILGAAQTAFDASYLIFARHYAASLEQYLNGATGRRLLVAARLEDRYLFPLHTGKIVTAAFGSGFSWFGFMTLLYTGAGVAATGFGLALGWDALQDAGTGWVVAYVVTIGVALVTTLGVGLWWFVGGVGERRLEHVLENDFAQQLDSE